jgi:hypothetical protein
MTEEHTLPDCLVLKLEENEVSEVNNKNTGRVDTTIYIFYDKKEKNYVLRGQRRWSVGCQSCAYSFVCKSEVDLADFLQYIFCKKNTVNEILYNYDNLPKISNEITFDFLNKYDHGDYEISGYNNTVLIKNRLIKILKMLRNVFNYNN